jgi:prevent-host-death family protein
MEDVMPKTISSSELRAQIKHILNEVGYGQSQYIVERFGEPTAAIVSVEDLQLLQAIKQQRAKMSLQETIASIRARGSEVDPDELDDLIEEARSEFYDLQHQAANA